MRDWVSFPTSTLCFGYSPMLAGACTARSLTSTSLRRRIAQTRAVVERAADLGCMKPLTGMQALNSSPIGQWQRDPSSAAPAGSLPVFRGTRALKGRPLRRAERRSDRVPKKIWAQKAEDSHVPILEQEQQKSMKTKSAGNRGSVSSRIDVSRLPDQGEAGGS